MHVQMFTQGTIFKWYLKIHSSMNWTLTKSFFIVWTMYQVALQKVYWGTYCLLYIRVIYSIILNQPACNFGALQFSPYQSGSSLPSHWLRLMMSWQQCQHYPVYLLLDRCIPLLYWVWWSYIKIQRNVASLCTLWPLINNCMDELTHYIVCDQT